MQYQELRLKIKEAGLNNKSFADLLRMRNTSITNMKAKGVTFETLVIARFCADYKKRGLDYSAMFVEEKSEESSA
jgi:hypothetical protein